MQVCVGYVIIENENRVTGKSKMANGGHFEKKSTLIVLPVSEPLEHCILHK